MTVAIIGPNSYIALRFRNSFEELGHNCLLISLRNKIESSYFDGDQVLFAEDLTETRVQSLCISCVVICASLTASECEACPEKAKLVNTQLVCEHVDLLAKAGVKRFLYLSTIKVYGEELCGNITEKTDICPSTVYARTHYTTEQRIRELGKEKKLEVLTLRLSNVFGSPLWANSSAWTLATNSFAKQMATQGKICVKSPTVIRNILPMSRLTEFIKMWVLGEMDTRGIKILNIGSSFSLPMGEIAGIVQRVYEGMCEIDPGYVFDDVSEYKLHYSVAKMLGCMKSQGDSDGEVVLNELKELCARSKSIFGR